MTEVSIHVESRDCSHCYYIQLTGAHLASYPMSTEGSSPKGQVVEHDTDHSHPPGAEFKNEWSLPSLPVHLHGMVLGHRDLYPCLNFRSTWVRYLMYEENWFSSSTGLI
jgi:hypothetical protein